MPPQTLPSQILVGGVSRQPQIQRSPDHVQDMDNCIVDPALGLIKRAGTRFIGGQGTFGELSVTNPDEPNRFYHWINRSVQERMVIGLSDQGLTGSFIQAWIVEGPQQGQTFGISFTGIAGVDFEDYMAIGSGASKDKMRAWTTADRTWFINIEVTPALKGDEVTYYFDGTVQTGGLTALRTHNPDITLDFGSIKDHRVPQFSDIIRGMSNGMEDTNVGEHFWTDFDEVDKTAGVYKVISVGAQPWFEQVRTEGVLSSIDQNLSPYVLKGLSPTSGDLSFEFWKDRVSGDTDTNPGPSLWTSGIPCRAIAFYQNRLWIGGRDTLITSQTGAAENLWRKHLLLAVDSDPIDQILTGPQVNNITRIHPLTTGALLVLTDGGQQYEVRSTSGAFTPSSTSIVATTKFPSTDVQPVNLGDRSYFLAEAALGSKLYEYYIFDQDRAALVTEISTAIPAYLPRNIKILGASESQEVLVFQSPDEVNRIYLCQQKFIDGNRQLAAWHRWEFDPSAQIETLTVFDTIVYILFRYNDGNGTGDRIYLETLEIGPPADDAGMGDSMRLDRRVDGVQGVYDSIANATSWTLVFRDDTVDAVILDSSWGTSQEPGTVVNVTNTVVANVTVMTANGNFTEGTAFIGRNFDQAILLSEPHVSDENGRNLEGALQLLRLTVNHEKTVAYDIEVTGQGRDKITHNFTSSTLGGLGTLLGGPVIETGDFTVPIMLSSQDTKIRLVNKGARNATWASLQFTVNFNPRRIGRV